MIKGTSSSFNHMKKVGLAKLSYLQDPMSDRKQNLSATLGFRGEDFLKSANQKQELPVVAMFVHHLASVVR
jgi:hypothetical protein